MQKPKVHLPEIQFLEETLLGQLTLFLSTMAPNSISPLMFALGMCAPVIQA